MIRKTLLKTLHHPINSSFLRYSLYESDTGGRHAYSISITADRYGAVCAEDVTDDRDAAERFLHLLHQEGAEPCHLYCLLEDALPLR